MSRQNRREILKAAGVVAAVAAAVGRAVAQTAAGNITRSVRTDVLDIGYEEHGDPNGTAIMLLHGFPYDIRSFDGCVAPLVEAGHRVLVPYLRGYGPTRFLDPAAPRMAEQAALAQDAIDFADRLGIDRFAMAGFDWGNRAACIVSILHPERVIGQVVMGGYSVQDTVTPAGAMPARSAAQFWYMWYFNTEAGRRSLEADRHDIIRYLWETWSPDWTYTDEAYARSAPSFDNPDFVDVVVHSYRHRQLNAPGEQRFLEVERQLAQRPSVGVPVVILRPGATGLGGRPARGAAADQSRSAADAARFTNVVASRIADGAGHDLPRHRPDAVVDALLELLG
jgi:pimeloyl-ACP methyl ester carboxylesterase